MEKEYWRQVRRQETIGRTLALASPYGSLNQVLIALANTGPESQWHFIEEAYNYGMMYFDKLVADPNDPPTDEKVATMEPFTYRPMPLADRLEAAFPPLASLVLTNILFLVVAVIAFNRYDVR